MEISTLKLTKVFLCRAITESGDEVRFVIPKGYDDMAGFAKAIDNGSVNFSEYGCKNSEELIKLIENQNKYLNTKAASGSFKGQPNLKLAGTTVDGLKYDKLGFPVFDGANLKFEVQLPDNLIVAADNSQFKNCTEALAKKINDGEISRNLFAAKQLEQIMEGEERITGLIWHHHQVTGKMQLVVESIHKPSHLGGNALWGEGVR